MTTRRSFLKTTLQTTAAAVGSLSVPFAANCFGQTPKGSAMQLGLVTYQWGMDWDVPTLIANCRQAKLTCVELRVDHKHGVSPAPSAQERAKVKEQFTGSGIELVGFGTNFDFHSTDAAKVRKNIDGAKEYVLLSRDCGASGVKVKPNDLPKDVEKEKTIAQIAKSLRELGQFAAEYQQEIRLEVHGGCAPIPIMKAIIDQVPETNVTLCWNCNPPDLAPPGLKENFESVAKRLGRVTHIRSLDSPSYPTKELFDLLCSIQYKGCLLIEEGSTKLTSEERIQQLEHSARLFAEWKR